MAGHVGRSVKIVFYAHFSGDILNILALRQIGVCEEAIVDIFVMLVFFIAMAAVLAKFLLAPLLFSELLDAS